MPLEGVALIVTDSCCVIVSIECREVLDVNT